MAKKRFTFADAKEKIKELEEALSAANVKLDDNVVTRKELKWLKVYKFITLFSLGYFGYKLFVFLF